MKKILLLGGSAQQVVAIETAKKLGYYTVLCDFLTDNPGQYVADKFYLVSTTDKDAVLEVAQKEKLMAFWPTLLTPLHPQQLTWAKIKTANKPLFRSRYSL